MRNLISIGKSLSTAALLTCLFLFLSACHGNTSEPRESRVYTVGPLQTIDDDTIDAVIRKLQAEVKDKDGTTILLVANPDCSYADVMRVLRRIRAEGYRHINLQSPSKAADKSCAEPPTP